MKDSPPTPPTVNPEKGAPPPKSSSELARLNTDLAIDRTVMAADRSLMAWVRTSLSMISFGFTIYKIIEGFQHEAAHTIKAEMPRNMGLFLTGLGTVAMVMGTVEYWLRLKHLREEQAVAHHAAFVRDGADHVRGGAVHLRRHRLQAALRWTDHGRDAGYLVAASGTTSPAAGMRRWVSVSSSSRRSPPSSHSGPAGRTRETGGRSTCGRSCMTARSERALLREGWQHVGKVFIVAIVMDAVYQFISVRWFYPGEAVMVAVILAVLPYLVCSQPGESHPASPGTGTT